MRRFPLTIIGFSLFILLIFSIRTIPRNLSNKVAEDLNWWEIQSVDTVKYSRDLAREKESDLTFNSEIDKQVAAIAQTGATHVAIGTPYDEEFIPFMKRWVNAARRYNLHVWFRGNFSGWERWFGYRGITKEEHTEMLRNFILSNGELFDNGDIFDSCTECENGSLGDPRSNGKVEEYKNFLITEHRSANDSFRKIGKNVRTINSMNGDVARLIMTTTTTQELGGIVTIDHYVKTSEQMLNDIEAIAKNSGGKVILGEFGAPILDLHGVMNEEEQAAWINNALNLLSQSKNLIGVNYWASFGASTKLWELDGSARSAVSVLKNYYDPKVLNGTVEDEIGNAIDAASVSIGAKLVKTDKKGGFKIPYVFEQERLNIEAEGFKKVELDNYKDNVFVVLAKEHEGIIFKIRKFFHKLKNRDKKY